jgi:hypothetical protein
MNYPAPVSVADLGSLPSRFAFEEASSQARAEVHETASMRAMLAALCFDGTGNILEGSFYTPGGLVKGIVEHAPDDGPSIIYLKNEATRLALGSFAGIAQPEAHSKLERLLEQEGLLDVEVTRGIDDTSVRATAAQKSRASAERLRAKTDQPLLLIPLCNGGFAAAIQTALYHRRSSPNADTLVYPIRFSREKSQEKTPRMTVDEIAYLGALAEGRTIVLHDDDAVSGQTLADAALAFALHFPNNEILGIVNADGRGPITMGYDGEWWEHPTPG